MSHNIKTKQKVYGMKGCEYEGKDFVAGEMPDENPEPTETEPKEEVNRPEKKRKKDSDDEIERDPRKAWDA